MSADAAPLRILVLNGPNLGRLGTREPELYGSATHADLVTRCAAVGTELGVGVTVRQTDDEPTMLGWLAGAAAECDAVVLNPAAWTHTSVAVRDAAATLGVPFIEVHLTNPLAREEFRHITYTGGLARGIVAGFGLESYTLAIRGLAARR